MRQAAVIKPAQDRLVTGQRRVLRGVWTLVIVIALLSAAVGSGLLVRRLKTDATPVSSTATHGNLTVRLHTAGWLSMDDGHHDDDQGGYQMPAQMMPGAPAGEDRRIGVPLTLTNTGGTLIRFNLAEEFFLRGGREDTPRRLHSDTFGALSRLTPGNAIDGILYFDTVVPAADDEPLYLEWRRDGDAVPLAIPLLGQVTHGHD